MSVTYTIYCTNWNDGVKYNYPILERSTGFIGDSLPKYSVKNPKLIKEVNALEQLTFKIYPNHPNYSQLKIKESVIKVYQDNKIIFKGKIVKEKFNFDKSKDITCEGLLGTLVDNRFNDAKYLKDVTSGGGMLTSLVFDTYTGAEEETFQHGWFNAVVINYNNLFCKTTDKLKIGEICPTVPKNSPLKTTLRYELGGRSSALSESVVEEIKDKTLLEILNYLIENGTYYTSDWSNPYPLKYFFPTYDESNTYLNIYTEKDLKNKNNNQKIVFGENMIDLVVEQDSSNMVTAIIPTGTVSHWNPKDGSITKEEVELEYYAPGYKQYENNPDIYLKRRFMYSKSGVDKYGWILGDSKASTFDMGWSQSAEANQAYLQKLAADYLSKQGSRIKETITINAADLSFASGYDIETFEFLKYVTISAPKHLNRTLNYLITKVELNLLEPEKNKITFNQTTNVSTGSSSSAVSGNGGTSISGNISNNTSKENQNYSTIQRDVDIIKNTYATRNFVDTNFANTEYVSSVQTDLTSYIDQQANEILTSVNEDTSIVKTVTYYRVVQSTEEGALEVVADDVEPTEGQIKIGDVSSCDRAVEVGDYVTLVNASQDYEALKQAVQSLISQTSDAVQLNFLTETVVNAINEAAGEVDSKYSFVKNYFRFDSDGSLLIGTVDSPFILKLTNNRISFLEDNVEVAFISENKFYIINGEFLNNLQLGNFTFSPCANGNLSFKKVK